MKNWNVRQPILGREIGPEDEVRERKAFSLRQGQLKLDL